MRLLPFACARRCSSTLLQRIDSLTASDIDPLTRRPLKPIDDAFFIEKTDALPVKDALRSIMHDFSLFKCLRPSLSVTDIVLSVELNLKEKQLSKLPKSAKMILYPYPFKDNRRILAIVPEELIDQTREEFGADIVGSELIIPEILDDTYEVDMDFDVIIAHSALSKEITGLRKKLEKMYPVKNRRTLGEDLENMIKHHKFGQFYMYNHATPLFETEVGTTEMAVEKIEENIRDMIKQVQSDCKIVASKRDCFTECSLKCSELLPQFIDLSEYVK